MTEEFKLDAYLDQRKALIETELDRRLPAETTPPARLHAAMRYSIFTGGKRLRPILCLAAADLAGAAAAGTQRAGSAPPDEATLWAALSLEVFHTYTLVHDDLPAMDDDALRRGRPTLHVAYGEANAILGGDALQALAFQWAAEADQICRNPHATAVMELALAGGSQGVVGGQVEDLAAATRPLTREGLDYIHQHKTADLFRAALRMGAIAAGGDRGTIDRLGAYGNALGLAFQVVDDLLDATADGAPPQETNCLRLYDPATARTEAQRLTGQALEALAPFDAALTRPLVALANHMRQRVC